MLEVQVGAATDSGRVRAVNEDSVVASGVIVAVADGMGGHAAGDVASNLAVARMSDLVASHVTLTPADVLDAIAGANDDILTAAVGQVDRAGMGTTLTGVGVVEVAGVQHWIVFNVGDSRVYRWCGGALSQVTVDHSEVEELVAAGRLTADEARVDPRRNVITRSLGTVPAPRADVWVFPPTPGERFLVCSDGLPLEIDDEHIAALLRSEHDPQSAADALVAAAVSAGGRDNVTAAVVDATCDPEFDDVVTTPRRSVMKEQGTP